MLFRETILALMLGLPAYQLDREEPRERRERLDVIAQAIADASRRATCTDQYASDSCQRRWPRESLDLAVLLVTQAYSESRLARNIHEGKCRSYECDPVRSASTGRVRHRARSLWQIHRIEPIETEWESMQGTDLVSTTAAAWAAAKLLSRGYRACRSIAGAVTRYAGIDGCMWSEAQGRARMFEGLRLRAEKLNRNEPVEQARASMR